MVEPVVLHDEEEDALSGSIRELSMSKKGEQLTQIEAVSEDPAKESRPWRARVSP